MAGTRELCYFSGSFFLNRIQEEAEKNGIETVRLDFPGEEADFSALSEQIGKPYDAILDINSRLPYLVDEKGERILNLMDAPFFNYIVDHPLYHHPGLVFPIRRYHAIGIDRQHCAYMKKYYPNLSGVELLPLGGSKALAHIPFRERKDEILFMGTYIMDDKLEHRIMGLRNQLNNATYQLALDVYDLWDDEKEGMEDCVLGLLKRYAESDRESDVEEYIADVYEMSGFPELLNAMFLVDQKRRNANRLEILSRIAETGSPMRVVGEGWRETPLSRYPNVEILDGCTMERSLEIMAMHKFLLDINPAFQCAMHDRVSSAFANGCVTISNMSRSFDEDIVKNKALLFYKKRGAAGIPEMLSQMNMEEMEDMGERAYKIWEDKYSFSALFLKLREIMEKRK